jgi:hypothetical protein
MSILTNVLVLALLLCMLIAAVVYALAFVSFKNRKCPKCGTTGAISSCPVPWPECSPDWCHTCSGEGSYCKVCHQRELEHVKK